MFTIVPVEYYSFVWHNLLLLLVMVFLLQTKNYSLSDASNLKVKNSFGIGLLLFCLILFGFRPISGKYFADMRTYANVFETYQQGDPFRADKDVTFEFFTKLCSEIMTLDMFFFTCFFLYIFPMYRIAKKFFNDYWAYAFFMLVGSYSFWSYGVNGIRNGIATSLFLWGFSMTKKQYGAALIVLSFFVHKSLMIPAAAYFITLFYKNPKSYLYFWLATIPLSLLLGGFWERFFLSLGFGEDDRFQSYLSLEEEAQQITTSFRWAFLLYSATGVYAGWFFIFKKKFVDPVYTQLFNIYLFANGFWVLVIRANFSNRFAYLSWFLLSLVIIYPLLKVQFYKNQHVIVVRILAIYFLFTYFMNFILTRL